MSYEPAHGVESMTEKGTSDTSTFQNFEATLNRIDRALDDLASRLAPVTADADTADALPRVEQVPRSGLGHLLRQAERQEERIRWITRSLDL